MGVDPELWRTLRIITDLGISPAQADEMSAVDLDYLLAMSAILKARRR